MASTTRFAPSPTGLLHLGHAYAALLAYQVAQVEGLEFVLRIEDIDSARCKPEFEAAIIDDLTWLGITWSGEVLRQSERGEIYGGVLAQLQSRGLLYPCFCTRKEIQQEIARSVEAPHETTAHYPGICRGLSAEESQARVAEGEAYALRLDMQKSADEVGGELVWEDRHRGEQRFAIADLGDEVIARKEIGTSYHLAVVVDDAASGVDLVVRGEDLFDVTPVQRVLQELLDYPAPAYWHHPLLIDATGKRLAKRSGAASLRGRREAGETSEQVRREIAQLADA